jgi:Predicted ATPase
VEWGFAVLEDRHLLYIVGEPGSGKSTLVDAMTAGIGASAYAFGAVRWIRFKTDPRVIMLGVRRGEFSGTDALAMNVQPAMTRWMMTDAAGQHVIAEGDRLANLKFFHAMRDAGWYLHVACLEATPLTLAQRRSSRAFLMGQPEQNISWVRGRQTKLRNLLHALPSHIVSYHRHDDGTTTDVIRDLVSINPVAEILSRGGVS